jgi:hypothetical protein
VRWDFREESGESEAAAMEVEMALAALEVGEGGNLANAEAVAANLEGIDFLDTISGRDINIIRYGSDLLR